MLEDMAVLTGGMVVSEDLGLKLENVTPKDLGHAKKVVIDKDNTTLIDGRGAKQAIEARIGEIRAQIEKSTSDYDKEKLQERLAKCRRRRVVKWAPRPRRDEEKKARGRMRCTRRAQRSKRASCPRRRGVAAAQPSLDGLAEGLPADQKPGVAIVRRAIEEPRGDHENAGGRGLDRGRSGEDGKSAFASTPRRRSTGLIQAG